MTQFQRDTLVVSLQEAVPIVERLIELALDPIVRNKLVARLATLDQRLAALRDIPVRPE